MAKYKSFPAGDTIKLSATFKVSRVLTDPTSETLTVQAPDATTSTPSVSNDGTGLRSATYTASQTGWHRYRWVSTGTAAGTKEGSFYVESSGIAGA